MTLFKYLKNQGEIKSIKDRFKIKPISYDQAMKMVIENHYLHRQAPCKYAFGLYDLANDWEFCGVIIYGTPASRSLQRGICGDDEANNVIELTRLWTKDGLPKNTESYLIGNTIPLVKEEIIVSYAEMQQGHVGIVYQATNWIYTGMSAKRRDWKIKDVPEGHTRHRFDEYGGINNAKKVIGDKMYKVERPRKHRYVFFNTNKRRKRELMKKLNYKQEPYPKLDKK